MTDYIVTAKYSGHGPHVSATLTYNVTTGRASVKWTCGNGYFMYKYFRFYILWRKKDKNGKWPSSPDHQTKNLIGGMSGNGYTNIWHSGSATKTIKAPSGYTQFGFGIWCASPTCGSKFNNLHKNKGWYNLTQTTNPPEIEIKSGEQFMDSDGVTKVEVSKYTDKIMIHWSLSGSVKATKVATMIQEVGSGYSHQPYPPSAPLKITAASGGDILFDIGNHNGVLGKLLPCTSYNISLAVASDTEDIVKQWEDDVVSDVFRTCEEAPTVYFESATSTGSTASITWRSFFPTTNTPARLNYLKYLIHDETTGADVQSGYVLQDITDDSYNSYSGTFTVTGLTPGHIYNARPLEARSFYDLIAMGNYSIVSFRGAEAPKLVRAYNVSSGTLVFGEPGDTPKMWIEITGSVGAFDINLQVKANNQMVINTWVDVGTTEISLDDNALDTMYKACTIDNIIPLNFAIYYSLKGGGGNGSQSVDWNMSMQGNAKTSRVGVGNTPRRAKAWVGVGNTPRRAVFWGGVGNTPRRTL